MFGLKLLKSLHQLVEVSVADLGIVQDVVAVLVVANLLAEGFNPFFYVFGRRGHYEIDYIRWK